MGWCRTADTRRHPSLFLARQARGVWCHATSRNCSSSDRARGVIPAPSPRDSRGKYGQLGGNGAASCSFSTTKQRKERRNPFCHSVSSFGAAIPSRCDSYATLRQICWGSSNRLLMTHTHTPVKQSKQNIAYAEKIKIYCVDLDTVWVHVPMKKSFLLQFLYGNVLKLHPSLLTATTGVLKKIG